MGSQKKDLEIIYNLQWKNKSGNGGDKANIIGMYDIPATTLNWEIFKSYLLKNSGTVGDDVKVSYITDSNREFPIESQTDFQIALYAFRRKARMGDIVNLKLDIIFDQQSQKSSRNSNDVETQFDNEVVSIVSSCCNAESPPEWFLTYMNTYMNDFKKNVTEEITSSVTSIVSNIKPHPVSQPPCYHSRKSKAENSKRRKLPLLTGEGSYESTKDLLKTLKMEKMESKLEHKLEKMESKTKKLKEKKLALFSKSSDSDGGNSSVKRRSTFQCENDEDTLQMDATPVNTQEMVPHMLGGEIYLHKWKVINTGKLPWTNETALMFTWGSKALKPLDTIVSVPHLKAGETGTISVRLSIPNTPGQYECYFHFHHQSRRFGHWLGCQIVVDPFDLKGNKSVLETTFTAPFDRSSSSSGDVINNAEDLYNIGNPVTRYGDIWQGTTAAANTFDYPFNLPQTAKDQLGATQENESEKYVLSSEQSNIPADKIVRDLTSRVEDLKLQDPTDTNCSSDSDNQSIISLPESNSSKAVPFEYVVVPIPDCFQIDEAASAEKTILDTGKQGNSSQESIVTLTASKDKSSETFDDNNNEDTNGRKQSIANDETSSNASHKSDIVMVSLPDINQDSEEFACVIVDGQKIMIPKKIIKNEYLRSVEKPEHTVAEPKPETAGASKPAIAEETTAAPSKSSAENNLETDSAAAAMDDHNAQGHFEENDFSSHCSAAGSCFSDVTAERNNRLFIFPQACPGYEVIQGNDFADVCKEVIFADVGEEKYNWEKSVAANISNVATEPVEIPPTSNRNPFADNITHVPNYQQTPPEERQAPKEEDIRANFTERTPEPFIIPPELAAEEPQRSSTPPLRSSTPQRPPIEETATAPPHSPVVHILPEGLVNGAVNVARSMINRIVPQGSPGRWVHGHWVSTNPDSPREANLQALAEMGFWNRDLNATLLGRYNDDLSRVVAELVQ